MMLVGVAATSGRTDDGAGSLPVVAGEAGEGSAKDEIGIGEIAIAGVWIPAAAVVAALEAVVSDAVVISTGTIDEMSIRDDVIVGTARLIVASIGIETKMIVEGS